MLNLLFKCAPSSNPLTVDALQLQSQRTHLPPNPKPVVLSPPLPHPAMSSRCASGNRGQRLLRRSSVHVVLRSHPPFQTLMPSGSFMLVFTCPIYTLTRLLPYSTALSQLYLPSGSFNMFNILCISKKKKRRSK